MKTIRNYIGGQWRDPEHAGYLDVHNPSTGEVIAQCPLSTAAEVDRAVTAAAAAYTAWSQTPVYRRCTPLLRLAGLFRDREEEVSRVLVEEMGKSLPDARAEIKRVIENCEVACGMPALAQGDKVVGCSFGIDGEVLRLPLGAFGMITPFNFPAMVPFWFLPYAVASGNTCVVKAPPAVPLTMQLIARWIDEAGFPPGVINVINGDHVAGQALVDHPSVQGISIVGQTPTVRRVAARCAELGKRCQALGSAKNHLVVMPDAPIDQAVRNMTTSCYGCAGQRCMAASVIVAVGDDTYRAVCRRFLEDSRRVIVADPLDPRYADEELLMGPVISAQARERILTLIDAGVREGATLALDGRGLVVPGRESGYFIGPTVFTDVHPGMELHRTEIFGPVVALMPAASLEEAIRIINDHQYGNGASIYTQSGYSARKFKLEVECGMIGVNVGIPAPVAYLPFGGMKASSFADIKTQGRAAIDFFTAQKVVTERYFPEQGLGVGG